MRQLNHTPEDTVIATEKRTPAHHPASRTTILTFTAGIIFFWAAQYVYTPIFPVYAGTLGASKAMVGLAVGAYGLTQMLLRIPLGVWSDALGKRRVFVVAGMAICALGALGFAFSRTPTLLVLFRGVMGVAAATWVCSTVLFTSYFPHRHPSIPLSIMTFAAAFGQVVGVASGGELAQRLGDAAPFWTSICLSAIGALILISVPEDATAKAMPLSREGMMRTASSRALILACVLGVIMQYVAWSTVNSFTLVFAFDRFGATRSQLGYLQTAGLVAYVLVTLFTPRLVAIAGETATLTLSIILLALGILPTPLVGSLGALTALQAIGGAGRGILYPLLLSLSIKSTAVQDRASAMGIFQATYALGMFAGPSFSGSVAEAFGVDSVFVMCGLICLACLPVVLAGRHVTASRRAS